MLYNDLVRHERRTTASHRVRKKRKEGESMAESKGIPITHEGSDAEMMSDGTLKRLIEYLRSIKWSDEQIVALLDYIASR